MWWRPAWFSLKGKVSTRRQTRADLLRHPAPQHQSANQPIRATQLQRAGRARLEEKTPQKHRCNHAEKCRNHQQEPDGQRALALTLALAWIWIRLRAPSF